MAYCKIRGKLEYLNLNLNWLRWYVKWHSFTNAVKQGGWSSRSDQYHKSSDYLLRGFRWGYCGIWKCFPISHCTLNMHIQMYRRFHLQNWKFSDKKTLIFYIAQSIDRMYPLEPPQRGDSNEYPQPMFSSRNKKTNVYPCKPQFYYIKVWFQGVKIIHAYFRDGLEKAGWANIRFDEEHL